MRIRNRVTGGVESSGVFGERRARASVDKGTATPSLDRVQISGHGVEIQRARALALAAPEVRQEMIDEILAQLERGEYTVLGTDVVPKMIREHFLLAGG